MQKGTGARDWDHGVEGLGDIVLCCCQRDPRSPEDSRDLSLGKARSLTLLKEKNFRMNQEGARLEFIRRHV